MPAKYKETIARYQKENDEIARQKESMVWPKRWKLISEGVIILAAAFKVLLFMANYSGFNGVTLAILMSYALVAILHISSTGYFLFGMWNKWRIRSDEKRYLRDERGASNFEATFSRESAHFGGQLKSKEVGEHSLIRENSGQNYFKTRGILKDFQLHQLISAQKSIGQSAEELVSIEGLVHQLDILQQDPVNNKPHNSNA